ncbi:HPP family protein [Rhizobium sp. BK377]|uniref:HPP family protein n=1 Tax=Rhizobium sp. BK377 TaxID=2587058 RepID=UPI0016224B13|nr:HPP family protein [Rhizobium sp. BK377]MBB3461692.1 CBS domain-containing membrane protein [Rhizobium sp. BK377]
MRMSNPDETPRRPSISRLFHPILAGATLRDRLLACLGALVSIALTGLLCGALFGEGSHLPLIVAPMGASAVLLFAVPASPLAQPWSIIGGNTISAIMGVAAASLIRDPIIATGVGVSLAIAAMSFTRCLHPPGGAAALTAVLGGPVVASWGMLFPFVPVALNSCLLVVLGLVFHKLSRHNYPHVVAALVNTHLTADRPPAERAGFQEEDIDAALAKLNETFDIDRADLGRLLRQVEFEAVARSNAEIRCADIMSRDVIAIDADATVEQARWLLLNHNIRTLPVRDEAGKLIGTVGLRELALASGAVERLVSPATTASADDVAMALLPDLTDGRTHAVIIVDEERRIVGLISQTDLLSAVARALPKGGKPAAVAA